MDLSLSVYLLALQLYETMVHTCLCWGSSFSQRELLCIPIGGFTVPSTRSLEMEGINAQES